MGVVWTARALADVRRITRYVTSENPVAARRIAREILVAGDSLALFPYRGRASGVPGLRELLAYHPYVIAYKIRAGNTVDILRVWHGAQDRR
ncbi:type II toxin-antitoxin system RelE/ParE family toxin [Acidisphaera sp. L21]|uniref:type II toxin-antitoxin system RelE/ParE family toxin n=1 Tax=Acidisphaera sp. L21 TaxID=1641851 RepID=UPI00131B4FA6|nr:type II toxin-antitoxin system RelE/ParE family toxin [Acidisphaera sp. L21]